MAKKSIDVFSTVVAVDPKKSGAQHTPENTLAFEIPGKSYLKKFRLNPDVKRRSHGGRFGDSKGHADIARRG